MNEQASKVLACVLIGTFGGIVHDLAEWQADPINKDKPFDWAAALPRWVRGFFVGLVGGLGYAFLPAGQAQIIQDTINASASH